jgi:DNA-binding transcriptional LysR family regulator
LGTQARRSRLGFFGSHGYLKANGGAFFSTEDLARHSLIGWDETVGRIGAADWLERAAPAEAVVYRTTSLVNQLVAANAGIGLAVLPCYLGDPEPELARALPEPIPELAAELWIVTHGDLKSTARVRAFFDLVGEGLMKERSLFEGEHDRAQRSDADTATPG